MATPTVTAALDKTSYVKGATMTLTVTATDADSKTIQVTVQVTDSTGLKSTPVTIPVDIVDPLSVSVTDTDGRTWTKVSTAGNVTTWTATA